MSIATNLDRIPPITLGVRLRVAREWRGLSQEDMGEILDKTRQTVSNYERGSSPIGRLELNAWAVATNTDVEWLKTGEEPSPTTPDGDLPGHPILQITERLLAELDPAA